MTMLTEDLEKLAKLIAEKVEADVRKSLVDVQSNLSVANLSNGTTKANGFNFDNDEASDFISELMNQVADELITVLVA